MNNLTINPQFERSISNSPSRKKIYQPEISLDWKKDVLQGTVFEQTHQFEISSVISVTIKGNKSQQTAIVTCSFDGNIKVFDVATQKCIKTIEKAHDGKAVRCLTQINSNTIASGGYDNLIRLWSINEFKLLKIIKGHANPVLYLLKINSNSFLSWSYDCNVKVWSLKIAGRCAKQFTPINTLCPIYNVCMLKINADKLLVSDVDLSLWDIQNNRLVRVFLKAKRFCSSLARTSLCTFMASYQHSGKIRRLNIINGQVIQKFSLFSNTGYNFISGMKRLETNYLAVLCNNGSLKILDIDKSKVVNSYKQGKQSNELTQVCQLNGGQLILGNSRGQIILIQSKKK